MNAVTHEMRQFLLLHDYCAVLYPSHITTFGDIEWNSCSIQYRLETSWEEVRGNNTQRVEDYRIYSLAM